MSSNASGSPRGCTHYNQQDGIITFWNGSQFYLVDLAYYPSDPNYDRIGSTEFTGGFIDEANQITQKAKDVVKSHLRYKLTEYGLIPKLLMTCNPAKNWVYSEFYKPSRETTLEPTKAFVQALVTGNPHISPHYVESLRTLRVRTLRERLFHGNWDYDNDPAALFEIDAITNLFTNPVDGTGDMLITADFARLGQDRTVIMVWKGLRAIHIAVYDNNRMDDAENILEALSTRYKVVRSHELVDEDGIGGGVVDHRKCKGFVGGATPFRDEQSEMASGYKVNYQNLRAQCYYTLADYVEDG